MTKTQAVSDLLDKNPNISAADALATLKKKGIETTLTAFYNYKSLWRKSKGEAETPANGEAAKPQAAPAPKAAGAAAAKAAGAVAAKAADGRRILATLQKLEELASDVGGYDELKKLIDFLEK